MYQRHSKEIIEVIDQYMQGIYMGNPDQLRNAFDFNAVLHGDIKGQEYVKTLNDYLEGVKNRQSPKELNEEFKMNIIGLEILGNVALAKLHLPMLGFNYYDYLSLTLIDGEWKIVHKLFVHVD